MIFLGLGFLLADPGLGLVSVSVHDDVLEVIATVTLALVLFLDAVHLELDVLRRDWLVPALSLGPGTLLTIGLVAGIAMLLLDLPLPLALLAGAILASTDPVLLRDVLRNRRIPRSVRQALSVEASTNDIIVLPILPVVAVVASLGVEVPGPSCRGGRRSATNKGEGVCWSVGSGQEAAVLLNVEQSCLEVVAADQACVAGDDQPVVGAGRAGPAVVVHLASFHEHAAADATSHPPYGADKDRQDSAFRGRLRPAARAACRRGPEPWSHVANRTHHPAAATTRHRRRPGRPGTFLAAPHQGARTEELGQLETRRCP